MLKLNARGINLRCTEKKLTTDPLDRVMVDYTFKFDYRNPALSVFDTIELFDHNVGKLLGTVTAVALNTDGITNIEFITSHRADADVEANRFAMMYSIDGVNMNLETIEPIITSHKKKKKKKPLQKLKDKKKKEKEKPFNINEAIARLKNAGT